MEPLTPDQRRQALASYVQKLEGLADSMPFDGTPLPYEICPRIEEVRWQLSLVDQLVRDELRELTNALNEWRGALLRWHVWMSVLDDFSEEDAWSLQWEFVESIAFQCMFYPVATRDRFTFVATNALHQVRMAADGTYSDRLDSDPPKAGAKPRFLGRSQKEAQLGRIATPLQGGADFIATLRSLDGEGYRKLTNNFRNLASHAIAPRLSIGLTNTVVRRMIAATQLVQQANGTFNEEEVPGKQSVSYGFGGTPPLSMRAVFTGNLAEFEKARACFTAYVDVLDQALATLPLRPRRP